MIFAVYEYIRRENWENLSAKEEKKKLFLFLHQHKNFFMEHQHILTSIWDIRAGMLKMWHKKKMT